MRLMKFYHYIILCICLAIGATGCHSSKTVATSTTTTTHKQSAEEKALIEGRIDSVAASYKNWIDVEIPVNLNLLQPKDFAVSGKATMIKDESIYISIRVFGFEAANIYINNDSIHATYKMNKLYIADDVTKLLKGLPIKVGDLQNLLLGRAFILGKGVIKPNSDISIESNNGTWIATPDSEIKSVDYSYTFDLANNMLKLLTILINEANPVLCDYGNAANTPAGVIAKNLTISTSIKKQALKASISWDTEKAKWNTGAKAKWKTPKGYKRVDANALLKAIN